MSPIRVGLIGLSSSSTTSWAAQGHLPYLLSRQGQAKYELVALCNTSVEAAKAAIKAFKLPPTTKPYGSPEDLAADPDIDLVVVNTRVDVHYGNAIPALKAGKAVWVEWPVAENVGRASQLLELAVRSGSKTIAGLQGQYSPVVLKLKQLIGSNLIGKVVSSDVLVKRSLFSAQGFPEGLAYFTDIKIGGNIITVAMGHVMDYIHSVLGEYVSFSSRAQIQKPKVTLIGSKETRTVASDVPDYVAAVGELVASNQVVEGATMMVNFRMEPVPFPGEPAFVWTIYGEKGDLRLTSPAGPFLHSADSHGDQPIVIETVDHATRSVIIHEWDWTGWQKELPLRARNTAETYERLANGESIPDFQRAVERHAEIDKMLSAHLKS